MPYFLFSVKNTGYLSDARNVGSCVIFVDEGRAQSLAKLSDRIFYEGNWWVYLELIEVTVLDDILHPDCVYKIEVSGASCKPPVYVIGYSDTVLKKYETIKLPGGINIEFLISKYALFSQPEKFIDMVCSYAGKGNENFNRLDKINKAINECHNKLRSLETEKIELGKEKSDFKTSLIEEAKRVMHYFSDVKKDMETPRVGSSVKDSSSDSSDDGCP